MRPTFFKGALVGGLGAGALLAATAAVAGSGIGGIFNLGQTNTVDATSKLNGTAANAMLDVANAGVGANSNGIVGRSASPLAPGLAGVNSGGGSGLRGSSTSGAGLYGQSTTGLGVRAITGGSQPALKATNTGTGPAAAFEAGGTAAPFTVNSGTKVTNLNADMVGGLHANELGRLASTHMYGPTTTVGTDVSSVQVTTTQPHELIHGMTSFYIYTHDTTAADFPCIPWFFINVDGVTVGQAGAFQWDTPPSITVEVANVSLDGVASVAPGTHTVSLYFAYYATDNGSQACNAQVGQGWLTAQTVPFAGDGTPPTVPARKQSHLRGKRLAIR